MSHLIFWRKSQIWMEKELDLVGGFWTALLSCKLVYSIIQSSSSVLSSTSWTINKCSSVSPVCMSECRSSEREMKENVSTAFKHEWNLFIVWSSAPPMDFDKQRTSSSHLPFYWSIIIILSYRIPHHPRLPGHMNPERIQSISSLD